MTGKSKVAAFFLSVLPGLPQIYLGYKFGILLVVPSLFFYVAGPLVFFDNRNIELALLFLLLLTICWLISVVHALACTPNSARLQGLETEVSQQVNTPHGLRKETFMLTVLIPGGGQMYMGEMNRGLPLLIAFFGWLTFSAYLSINLAGGFIVLWGLLPIIWAYSLFDALHGWRELTEGQTIPRPALLDEFEGSLSQRRPRRGIAIAFSAVPGLGHLYLGKTSIGLAMMAGFFLLLSLNNYGFLNLAFVIVPLLWFYSVFDILAQLPILSAQDFGRPNAARDHLVGQRWLGYIAVAAGLLIMVERLIIPFIGQRWMYYVQPVIVSLVLVGVGVRLLLGTRQPASPNDFDRQGEQS